MSTAIDARGHKYGKYKVLERDGTGNDGIAMWKCKCSCGVIKTVSIRGLRNGSTVSCGCHRKERLTKHGECGTPEYMAWCGMMRRCYNINDKRYNDYGVRGIKVCDEWRKDFTKFLEHIGKKPRGCYYSVDRIENNKGYEPGNVRWATGSTQRLNQDRIKRYTYNGKTLSISEWGKILGVHPTTLYSRLLRGASTEEAFNMKKHTKPNKKGGRV